MLPPLLYSSQSVTVQLIKVCRGAGREVSSLRRKEASSTKQGERYEQNIAIALLRYRACILGKAKQGEVMLYTLYRICFMLTHVVETFTSLFIHFSTLFPHPRRSNMHHQGTNNLSSPSHSNQEGRSKHVSHVPRANVQLTCGKWKEKHRDRCWIGREAMMMMMMRMIMMMPYPRLQQKRSGETYPFGNTPHMLKCRCTLEADFGFSAQNKERWLQQWPVVVYNMYENVSKTKLNYPEFGICF